MDKTLASLGSKSNPLSFYNPRQICPLTGVSKTMRVVDGKGRVVVHVCCRKNCPACGERWREMHCEHYLRVMEGHLIYYRTVSAVERWDTISARLTRKGYLWHAPRQPDGTRMLFSTCPTEGHPVLQHDRLPELLDPRWEGLGAGGSWTSCRAWAFDHGSRGSSISPDPGGKPPRPDEEKVVELVYDGDLSVVIERSKAFGIIVDARPEEMTGWSYVFSALPEPGSGDWWEWIQACGLRYKPSRGLVERRRRRFAEAMAV